MLTLIIIIIGLLILNSISEELCGLSIFILIGYFIYKYFASDSYTTSITSTLAIAKSISIAIIALTIIIVALTITIGLLLPDDKKETTKKDNKETVNDIINKYLAGEGAEFAMKKYKTLGRHEKSNFIDLLSNEGNQKNLIERLFMIEFLKFARTKKDQNGNYIFHTQEYISSLSDIFGRKNRPGMKRIKKLLSQYHQDEILTLEEIKFHSTEKDKNIYLIKLHSCATNSSNTISLD